MIVTLDIWGLIAFAIGTWILLDGLIFGLMPQLMRRLMDQMDGVDDNELRQAGLICAAIGAVIVFLIVRAPGV